jgi:hypothetical protein
MISRCLRIYSNSKGTTTCLPSYIIVLQFLDNKVLIQCLLKPGESVYERLGLSNPLLPTTSTYLFSGEYSAAKAAMRVIYCVTLSLLLISHAFRRVPTSSASPLPLPGVHHRDLLASNPQDLLIGEETSYAECSHAMASIAGVNSELLMSPYLPSASDRISSGPSELNTAFNLEEYPYPTTTKTPKRSRTKSSRHSSTQGGAMASTSVAPGTCGSIHIFRLSILIFHEPSIRDCLLCSSILSFSSTRHTFSSSTSL